MNGVTTVVCADRTLHLARIISVIRGFVIGAVATLRDDALGSSDVGEGEAPKPNAVGTRAFLFIIIVYVRMQGS